MATPPPPKHGMIFKYGPVANPFSLTLSFILVLVVSMRVGGCGFYARILAALIRILSSCGVQQGDPLGPLLFSLALSSLQDDISVPEDLLLQVWYLDDGTIIGPRSSVSKFFQVVLHGPQHGFHLNPHKCEVFWPDGDNSFHEPPQTILRPLEGVCLLGSPLWGDESFFQKSVN